MSSDAAAESLTTAEPATATNYFVGDMDDDTSGYELEFFGDPSLIMPGAVQSSMATHFAEIEEMLSSLVGSSFAQQLEAQAGTMSVDALAPSGEAGVLECPMAVCLSVPPCDQSGLEVPSSFPAQESYHELFDGGPLDVPAKGNTTITSCKEESRDELDDGCTCGYHYTLVDDQFIRVEDGPEDDTSHAQAEAQAEVPSVWTPPSCPMLIAVEHSCDHGEAGKGELLSCGDVLANLGINPEGHVCGNFPAASLIDWRG